MWRQKLQKFIGFTNLIQLKVSLGFISILLTDMIRLNKKLEQKAEALVWQELQYDKQIIVIHMSNGQEKLRYNFYRIQIPFV